jgi:hypothetical protein
MGEKNSEIYTYKQPDLTEEIKSRSSRELKHVALCDMPKCCVGWHVVCLLYTKTQRDASA